MAKKQAAMTFEAAKRKYVHRFTMEHVPGWATKQVPPTNEFPNGWFYAPQFATDWEWYQNTLFPPHNPYHRSDCHTTGQTWPLGQRLNVPFTHFTGK